MSEVRIPLSCRRPANLPKGKGGAPVEYSEEEHALVIRGAPDAALVGELRDCAPDDVEWQVVVDQVAMRAAGSHGSSMPTTLWGQLMAGLPSGDEDAWVNFMKRYRRTIGRTLARLCRERGMLKVDRAELADEFFGWFFEKGIARKLRRVTENGSVNRFRGYLVRCLERTGGRPGSPSGSNRLTDRRGS